jgi:hypothetical protein
VGSIEVDQDLDHARVLWRVQRIGWAAMALVILAGLLGLLGSQGPLTRAQASTTGLSIDYDRFARHGATSSLVAEVEPAPQSDTATLWLAREYLDGVEIESVIPDPERTETRDDVVLFTFMAKDRSRPARITFNVRPGQYWSEEIRVGVDGGGSLSVRQFIYP